MFIFVYLSFQLYPCKTKKTQFFKYGSVLEKKKGETNLVNEISNFLTNKRCRNKNYRGQHLLRNVKIDIWKLEQYTKLNFLTFFFNFNNIFRVSNIWLIVSKLGICIRGPNRVSVFIKISHIWIIWKFGLGSVHVLSDLGWG